jgi:glucan phosphoethanolaminetransferase (alkaline phosphatase superfamily)
MFYMTHLTSKNEIIEKYRKSLPTSLVQTYDSITRERTIIYYTGYALGLVLAIIIITYNTVIRKEKVTSVSLVCTIVGFAFIVNYFYYILTPKSKWMLNEIRTPEETKAWLEMYKNMSFYYHSGLLLGLVSIGALGYAFR